MGFSFSSPRSGDHWFRIGTVDVTTSLLIAGLATISMFLYALSPSLLDPLPFTSGQVTHGQVWRLLTWPMANTPSLYGAVAIFLLFYFGREIERAMGRARFLRFVILVTVVPAVVGTVIGVVSGQFFGAVGITYVEIAVIIAYVVNRPTARTFFDLPFWALVAVVIGVDVLQLLGLRDWPGLEFLILVCGVAAIGTASFGVGNVKSIPSVPLPAVVTGDNSRKVERIQKRAAHLHVVQAADMDSLLDKIAEHGIDSLSAAERRRLDEHSGRGRGQQ